MADKEIVTQRDLAKLQAGQEMQKEVNKFASSIKNQLLGGAAVEKGPLLPTFVVRETQRVCDKSVTQVYSPNKAKRVKETIPVVRRQVLRLEVTDTTHTANTPKRS